MSSLLAHTLLTEQPSPQRHALFLHGILGRGSNLRALARGWLRERSGWGAVLVDLRQHGESQGFAPPHTLAAAAQDLVALAASLPAPVEAVIGHSFGGKVALAYSSTSPHPPAQTWLLDSDPGPRGSGIDDIEKVFDFLRTCPAHFTTRALFVRDAESAGFSPPLAAWLATLLEPEAAGGLRLGIDLATVEALFADYAAQDLWPLLEQPAVGQERHVVVAGRSMVFDAARRQRLQDLAARGALRMHIIEQAGHWLHTDAPEQLQQLLRDALP